MARQCMRPGCDRPVAACLTYDNQAVAVWLDDPVTDGQPAQQVCANHAATLTAPIGWTITDRRPKSVGTVPEPAPEAHATITPEPSPPPEPEPEPEIESAPAETERVRPDDGADRENPAATADAPKSLGRRGKPRGKLLDRAFEWTGPQHSVLTTGDPPSRPDSGEPTED